MKKAALAVVLMLLFALTLTGGAKAAQFDYSQFEGLPYDPPIVTLISPSPNATYNVPDVPLNVTIQIRGFIYHNMERMRWLNYSLDGQTAVPLILTIPSMSQVPYSVYGNDVLTGLSDGDHNLTVYGETFIGGLTCYFNETVLFRVDTSFTPRTGTFPEALVFVSSVGIVVAVIGLLFYFKKRRRGYTNMNARSESKLRCLLCNAGYSENVADKILAWYTNPGKSKPAQAKSWGYC
jgi:hypothetical protein